MVSDEKIVLLSTIADADIINVYTCVMKVFLGFQVQPELGYWHVTDSANRVLSLAGERDEADALPAFAIARWRTNKCTIDAGNFWAILTKNSGQLYPRTEQSKGSGDWVLAAGNEEYGQYKSKKEAVIRGGLLLWIDADINCEYVQLISNCFVDN